MRMRRKIFHPQVRATAEVGRPITVNLAGLVFDLTVDEARQFAQQLNIVIDTLEGAPE
ncbi:hypothetical protein FIV07_22500 [Mycobacterium sp. THAF192]|nr:hypothetical protein FIV07_22500 [Mycobacterium sp. THAF192]